MPTIDADAHVIETERTWDFMDKADQKYRPILAQDGTSSEHSYWIIDGQVRMQGALARADRKKFEEFSEKAGRNVQARIEAVQMDDIGARLEQMDETGVDIQVLHTTLFLSQSTTNPKWEIPICWGYNRWLADVWKQGQGRLRWSAVLPLLSIPHALEQLHFAHENGAVAVLVRAIEGERLLHDPYFFPIYEEANSLNMAIVAHGGNANPYIKRIVGQYLEVPSGAWASPLQNVGAFLTWGLNGMPQKFPGLRFGMVECQSAWLPYVLDYWTRRFPTYDKQVADNLLRDNRMYTACQTDEDVAYLVSRGCEDNLLIGTDYGHSGQSAEMEAVRNLRGKENLDPTIVEKILSDNPQTFYGI
jgi:uncharacterized protein